jgi:hypothetical protein
MDTRRFFLLAGALAGCGGAAAGGGGATAGGAAAGGERVDISSVRADLDVYTDGKGNLLALVEPDPERPVPDDLRLFYGDGKTFHGVPASGASADGLKFEIGFADPRIASSQAGSVKRELGKVVVSCYGTDVELGKLPAPEAQAMVGGATFIKSRTRYAPLALVRDGDRYLYVDYPVDASGDDKYRVWSGSPGKMRRLEVVESKYDSRSNEWTFRTRDGILKGMRDPDARSYTITLAWQDRKDQHWSALERAENWKLIYEGLGIYPEGRSPTPCDPMLASAGGT